MTATTRKMRTLIAAHDGTSRGLDVVARGREIADAADARLLVVHVIEKQMPYWSRDPDHQHLLREDLAHIFDPVREIGGPGVETRAVGARSVIEGLVAAVEDEHAGVIVIGTSHHGPLGRMLYGDVAHQLMSRCNCHVDVTPVHARKLADAA